MATRRSEHEAAVTNRGGAAVVQHGAATGAVERATAEQRPRYYILDGRVPGAVARPERRRRFPALRQAGRGG